MLILPLLCSACVFPALTRPSGWETSETFNRPYDEVWETVLAAVNSDGNRWKFRRVDKEDGEIEVWRVKNIVQDVSRYTMDVEIVSDGDGYAVQARVLRERVFPSWQYDVADPEGADWEWVGYEKDGTDILFTAIRLSLKDYED